MRYINDYYEQQQSSQESLFSTQEQHEQLPRLAPCDPWSDGDILQHEFNALGLYLSAHPFSMYRNAIKAHDIMAINDIEHAPKASCQIAGIIGGKRLLRTKKQKLLCFLTLSDETGQCDVTIFEEEYNKVANDLVIGNAVYCRIGIEKMPDNTRLTAVKVNLLSNNEQKIHHKALTIMMHDIEDLDFIKDMMSEHKKTGNGAVYLQYHDNGDNIIFLLSEHTDITQDFTKALKTKPSLQISLSS